MIVYVCCAGGMTSSLLCQNIKKAAADDFKIYINSISDVIRDYSTSDYSNYDIILAYGAASLINEHYVKENKFDNIVDLILVSPQVRHQLQNIKSLMDTYSIPTIGIDMRTFGTMNGGKMLEEILKFK